MSIEVQDGAWVTLAEAAPILGVSVDTVRRRLKRGELQARLVHTQHGPTWEVCLGNVQGDASTVGSAPRRATEGQQSAGALVESIRLVGRLQEENRNLAGQLGYVQAQLEQARSELRALQAPADQEAQQGPSASILGAIGPETSSETPTPPPPAPVPSPTPKPDPIPPEPAPRPIPPGKNGHGLWGRVRGWLMA